MDLVDFEFCMAEIADLESVTTATSVLIIVLLMFRTSLMTFASAIEIKLTPGCLYKHWLLFTTEHQTVLQIQLNFSVLYSFRYFEYYLVLCKKKKK